MLVLFATAAAAGIDHAHSDCSAWHNYSSCGTAGGIDCFSAIEALLAPALGLHVLARRWEGHTQGISRWVRWADGPTTRREVE